MNKVVFCTAVSVVWIGLAAGCSSPPTPALPTHEPFSLPTLFPATPIPYTATAVPTATYTPARPTQTPVPATATRVEPTQTPLVQGTTIAAPAASPTAVVLPTASRSPTVVPTPASSPTSAVRSGSYVTDLRIDPAPVRGPELYFYVRFLNSTEQEQNYRWAIYIFRADTQRGIGETARTDSAIPTGATELVSNGSWKLPLGGPCDYFYAQVGWANADNKIIWFTTSSGSVFQKGFTVCPP